MSDLPDIFNKEFGFTQSGKTYTLKEFANMANKFKTEYFGCPPYV